MVWFGREKAIDDKNEATKMSVQHITLSSVSTNITFLDCQRLYLKLRWPQLCLLESDFSNKGTAGSAFLEYYIT